MSSASIADTGTEPRAWVLPIMEAPQSTVNHIRNVLRYAGTSEIVSPEQLAQLFGLLDNFVVPVSSPEDMVDSASAPELSVSQLSATSGEDEVDDAVMNGFGKSLAERLSVVAATMEHPTLGVKIGRQRYHMRNYDNVFVGADAVKWMIARNFAESEEAAVTLGQRLVQHGYFMHVAKRPFENANLFYRFNSHPAPLTLPMPVHDTAPLTMVGALLRLVYAVHDESVPRWLSRASPAHLRTAFPVVLLWAQQNPGEGAAAVTETLVELSREDKSLRLALWGFHRANGFACMSTKGQCPSAIGNDEAVTPIIATVDMVDASPPSGTIQAYEMEGRRLQHPFVNKTVTTKLKKEFASNAKPSWIQFFDEEGKHVLPDAVAKVGDDLRQDLSVQLIFQAEQAFWAAADVSWRCGRSPTVGTFDVVVTDEKAGYLEFIRNASTVKEVAQNNRWKDVNLHALAPSIVGSLMSGFVIGVRDRHSENFMLVEGDDDHPPRMVSIDYGYLLMDAPGGLALDTPRLTLQPQLIKLLKAAKGHNEQHTLLEDIQADLITAYRVLREQYAPFVSFCKVALSATYTAAKIESTLWGAHCFRAGQPEAKAIHWLTNKVQSQLVETNFRRGAKHAIVKGYYAFKGLGLASAE